ncbi:MAG: hypothetical protein ABIR32_20740 [Ilumatobacteraceae bacterium]
MNASTTTSPPGRPGTGTAWLLRLVWLLQPVAFVPLLGDASQSLGSAGSAVVAVLGWASWAAVLLATLVPSTVSLTAGRLASPVTVGVALVAGIGPSVAGWKVAAAIAAGGIAIVVWFSGEVGAMLAQGSAYGAEERFPLKPPVPYLVPMIAFWLLLSGCALAGATLLANESWIFGGLFTSAAIALAWFVGPRFHQLARRWLVVVPVGVVVHDPMLLVENALFRNSELEAIHLAPVGTEAADLTGGTAGVPIEIVLREMDTIIKADRDKPQGAAIHVRSLLVSPTRPGKALRAAAARNLPVG